MTFEKIVKFYPAYDKRNIDPAKNYGIHGVDLLMLLKGEDGAVQFRLYTNWQLPHVQKETDAHTLLLASNGTRGVESSLLTQQMRKQGFKDAAHTLEMAERLMGMGRRVESLDEIRLDCFYHPMPTDLGYHSPRPMYDGQESISSDCEWIKGGVCYYDGSGLNASPIFDVLLREGSDGVWRELEKYYVETFLEVAK